MGLTQNRRLRLGCSLAAKHRLWAFAIHLKYAVVFTLETLSAAGQIVKRHLYTLLMDGVLCDPSLTNDARSLSKVGMSLGFSDLKSYAATRCSWSVI